MSGSVGASFSRKFLASVLATGFFLGVSLAVSGVVGAQQTETMNASWYGPGFEGATTANGEVFDPSGFTAAHKELPFGTTLEVCYEGCVNVRINDRGPFIEGRDLDLAQGAADAIGLTPVGHAVVNVTYTDGSAPVGPSGETAPQPEQPTAQTQPDQTQPETPVAEPQTQPEQTQTEAPVVEPQDQADEVSQFAAAADGQYFVEDQYDDGTAAGEQYSQPEVAESAADEQYSQPAAESAADEQYSQPAAESAPAADAAPEPLAPPEPAAVEVAPLELATPGSTVERRIALALAAPPENYTGPLPENPPAEAASTEGASTEGASTEGASVAQGEAPVEVPVKDDSDEAEAPPSGSVAAVAGLTVLPDTGGLPLAPLAGAAALVAAIMVLGARAFRK